MMPVDARRRTLTGWGIRAGLLALTLAVAGSGCALFRRSAPAADSSTSDVPLRLDTANPYGAAGTESATTNAAALSPAELGPISSTVTYRLRVGDTIIVNMRVLEDLAPLELAIDENGLIRLPLVNSIRAVGYTSSELEDVIQKTYIEKRIYKYITVHVFMPQKAYYVQGEVRQPGRYSLTSGITLMQALATAGGPTDFARTSRVQITRNGRVLTVDADEIKRKPELDIPLETSDVITVPQRTL